MEYNCLKCGYSSLTDVNCRCFRDTSELSVYMSADEYEKQNPAIGRCDVCGRVTYDHELGQACLMRQPDGSRCHGTFLKQTPKEPRE